ncbi:MAG TPA: TonB-dependent receptor [Pelobium sp.]|nr:TonB-dependent receptor [Pelobium sp.]
MSRTSKTTLLAMMSLILFVLNGMSQTIITGTVKSVKGEVLPGVSIRVKESKEATSTDINGVFSIHAPKGSVIILEYLGFKSREVVITENSVLNLVLQEDVKALKEVVIIGYGTVNREDLTGSVGQVDIKDLNKAPVASFDEALAGRVAGVQVSSAEGQPGKGINIVIRGANSLTQNNSPLYVIDGFPIEDPTNAAINPQDIQSIDVLKDASATAIYGSRGANGVIIIETKRGKPGKSVISFGASMGSQNITKTMDLMSPYEFVSLQQEIDPVLTATKYLSDRTLESYKNEKGYDWQDELFRTAPMQTYNLSLSGGNTQTKYFISGSALDQSGILINSGLSRYQGRFSLDHSVSDKFKVGLNTNYSNYKTNGRIASDVGSSGSASSYLLYSIWGYRPVAGNGIDLIGDFTDPDINENNDFRVNPLISTQNEHIVSTTKSMMSNAYATYNFTKDLVLKVTGGINNRMVRDDGFFNSQTARGTSAIPTNTRGVNGSVLFTETSTWLNENTLRYKKELKKHVFDLLGGVTLQGQTRNQYGFLAQQLPNESLGLSGLDEGTPLTNYAQESENKLLSFLGRANYNYRYKYYATASFRADGSSKFFPNHRWGYFPSGSVAWRISREDFMKNLTFISESKIRVSYGETGNNRVDDYAPYSSLSFNPVYSPYQLTNYSFFNQTPGKGVIPATLPNEDLKWETTSQFDIGYDLGLFNNKISITADVYRKTTRDLLLNANTPYSTGYAKAFRNIGKVKNEGLELTLNTVNIDNGNFKWNTNFNISFNRNKILALNGTEKDLYSIIPWETAYVAAPLYKTSVGQSVSQFYGYVWDGIYQTSDFDLVDGVYKLKADVTKNGTTNVQPGDVKYKDFTGDLDITDADKKIIGNPLPKHTGGFSNNFQYKRFDLNVFFQWSYGNDVMNANRIVFEGNGLNYVSLNQFASYTNRWTPENQSNTLPRVGGQGPRGVYSSRTVEDGSYLRLKTLSLGYSVPDNWVKKLNMKTLSFSLSAQNLVTWTNYTGMDPEVSVKNSTLTQGFDYSAYPRARTITFDLKLTL